MWERQIPLLASLQGGVAASLNKCREATETDAAGVVFLFVLNRKTTPALRAAEASRNFIDRSATPPCGDARRGSANPKLLDIFVAALSTAPTVRKFPNHSGKANVQMDPPEGTSLKA